MAIPSRGFWGGVKRAEGGGGQRGCAPLKGSIIVQRWARRWESLELNAKKNLIIELSQRCEDSQSFRQFQLR